MIKRGKLIGGGFDFCFKKGFRDEYFGCMFKLIPITLLWVLKTETDLYIHISHFILYIDLFYGLFDHSTYDFISWLMILFRKILMRCGHNQYYVYDVHGLYLSFMCLYLNPSCYFMIQCLYYFVDCLPSCKWTFEPKIYKKPIPFLLFVLRLY